MIRQNRRLQFIILLTLVCLVGTISIAYAVLSTTLNINGTAQVMDASWNVRFENVVVNPGSVSINPTITDNDKITFSADLTTPGQFYKFTVDVVNSGSIDAMIESVIKNPELTEEQKKYLRYEVEYVDGASISETHLLKSSEKKTISVMVSFRNDIPVSELPTTDVDLDLEIRLVYVQATSAGVEVPAGEEKIVRLVSGDLNTVGSEILIGEEPFYLMKVENNKVYLFAKYNLYVGNSYDGSIVTPYGDEATGIQHPDMRGYIGSGIRHGVDDFVYTKEMYWANRVDSFPSYVYTEESKFYSYFENYKKYLEGLGVVVEIVRAISYEELVELGCNPDVNLCIGYAPKWVYYTTYWTGSLGEIDKLWAVFADDGGFIKNTYYAISGVKPIVEISASYF